MACIYLLNSRGGTRSFDFDITYFYPIIVTPYFRQAYLGVHENATFLNYSVNWAFLVHLDLSHGSNSLWKLLQTKFPSPYVYYQLNKQKKLEGMDFS